MLSIEESLNKALINWHVEKKEEHILKIVASFSFPASFSGFAGHFPNQPVLPAIVQLGAIRHLAKLALSKKLQLISCKKTKFSGVVSPDQELAIIVNLIKKENTWQARFSIKTDNIIVAKGRVEFAD